MAPASARHCAAVLLCLMLLGLTLGDSATPQPRTPTCGNVQPDEQLAPIAFDCTAFNEPGSQTQCSSRPDSFDSPASFVNCCECSANTNVPLDLSVTMTDAVKVSGSQGQAVVMGDVLSYTISVSVESCLPGGQLDDVVLTDQLPVNQFLVATTGITLEPEEAGACSLDERSRLTCKWSSLPCFATKKVTITGTVVRPGRLTQCAMATTSSGDLGDLPNDACAKPVLVASRVLGSCCTPTGGCVARLTKAACRGSPAQGGIGAQTWYSSRAACSKSCTSIKKAALSGKGDGVTSQG